jgi:hypothetical protein
MLKFGICTIEALRGDVNRPAQGRVRQAAVTLLNAIGGEPDADTLRERLLLELSDDRGAYKRTYRNRFAEFDEAAAACVEGRWTADEPLRVLDCGISDGRTAIDFFRRLGQTFGSLDYLGTDYDPFLTAISRDGVTVVVSSKLEAVQMIRPPFVFNYRKPERWVPYPVNRWLFQRLQSRVFPLTLEDAERGSPICLFCDEAIALSKEDERFRLGQHDVLAKPAGRFHVVRMMNLLNATYFTADEFREIAENVRASLIEGGIFVAGSNQDAGSEVAGAVMRFDGGGFTVLRDTGLLPQFRECLLTPEQGTAQ